MAGIDEEGITARLGRWAAGFKLDDAPQEVIDRMKTLVLDYLRVVSVGASLPWSRSARRLVLSLAGHEQSTVLLYGDRIDPARAAFINGSFAHACDLDDTHVGSMHHAGASVWPAVFAIAERDNLSGRAVLEAGICGYEASLRIGLAAQPAMFHRGFIPTPICGTFGAAVAVGKLLGFDATEMAGTIGAATTYAGGLAQFYHSGSFTKRINGGKAAESGVMSALLVREGIWGPRDILEGEAGFFRAFSGPSKPELVTDELGERFRLMEVSTKAHAAAGRVQASLDAGLLLGAAHRPKADAIDDVEVGIPKVIEGRLTHNDPPDLQSAQVSVPFGIAMTLLLGGSRGANAGMRPADFEAGLKSPDVCALAARVRCVVDPEVEALTDTGVVPSRVTLKLANGQQFVQWVEQPRGSPERRMTWDDLRHLFTDAVGEVLTEGAAPRIVSLVDGLDRADQEGTVRRIIAAYQATPQWLRDQTTP